MSEGEQTSETRTAAPRTPVRSPIVRVGEKVGRFSILSELGAGGMGRIYEAHDPELDRRIALKLLRDSGEEGHRQRLVREAQALARLDHPNVVTVHDVGVHEGSLFVAMALFRGGTLKDWSAKNPIGSKERFESAIGLLVDAGRGLVAAHDAGLVHRDVKPSNILIGEDGRARVADFGIARALASPPSRPRASYAAAGDKELQQSLNDTQPSLTRTGASLGTPAYMAPEQFGDREIDANADQFSFCVMAWELLFGVRPFGGDGVRQRLAEIRNGEPRRRAKVEVDAKVVALLERGLRYRSSVRHRRLAELVDALSQTAAAEVGPRGRSLWRWALAVGGVAAVGAGAAYRIGQTEQLCTGAVAAFEEVWGDEQRDDMRNAVLGSGLEFAPGAWVRLEAGLDRYGQAWRRAHREACEATKVRGEQSPARMEGRLACLEDARRSVGALVTLVSLGEASVLASEQQLQSGLRRVEECEDIRETPTPAELSILDAVADAGALRRAGQPRKALAIVVAIAERLDGETSAIVRARVLMEHGRGLAEASPRRALDVLSEAYRVAHTGGFSQIASAAARGVTELHVRLSGNTDAVQRWLGLAKSQSGATSVSEEYELAVLEGMLAVLQGNDDGAAGAFERSVEIAKGESALLPDALRNLATYLRAVDAERAAKTGRQALKEFANLYGRDHPRIATFEESLAGLLARTGRREEAEQLARRALARATETWGPGHVATGRYLVQLAEIRCRLSRDVEEGTRLATTALKLLPPSEPTQARFETLLALEVCVRSNDPTGSLDATRQLLGLSKELYGNDHFRTLLSRTLYAAALFQSSDLVETRKQVSLSSAATDVKPPGWEQQHAAHVHSVLAVLAGGFAETTAMALENAEAGRRLNKGGTPQPAVTRVVRHADLCSVKRVLGDLEAALSECILALKFSRAFDQGVSRATLEYETGRLLNALGRNREALPHMEEATRLFKEVNGPQSYHAAIGEAGLAAVSENLGRYAKAERHYRASSELFSALQDATSSWIEVGAGLARTIAHRGRVSQALALLEELEQLQDGMNMRDRALLFWSRGAVLHQKSPRLGGWEYTRAVEFYRAAGEDDAARRVCSDAPLNLAGCASANTKPERRAEPSP